VYSEAGQAEVKGLVNFYMENAAIIRRELSAAGLTIYGGEHAPYVWIKTPDGMDSWGFFDHLLNKANVVGTPGSGFGAAGEGYYTPTRSPGGAAVMEKAPERVRKPSPRYKVLLHNDPVNTMEYVVSTLRQVVPQLSEQDAMAVMMEAHNTGVGLVIVCDLEPAEFYCETLKAKGLTSTIEPEN
jgi:ATP-dependent Clp protease adaptor protein ClpS